MSKPYRLNRRCFGFVGVLGLTLLIVLLQVFVLIYVCRTGNFFDSFRRGLSLLYDFLSSHRWYIVGALAFLPTLGFPISPLWILAGALWGMRISLTIVAVCLVFNLVFSYLFYQRCFNRLLYKWLLKKKRLTRLLRTDRMNSIKWCFLIQLMPQLPYAGQCYVLSTIEEVNFWHYLSISWVFQFLWALGFILGGNALKYGQLGLTIFGLILLVVYLTYKGFEYYKKL